MQTLNVSWEFYLVYNHQRGELFLHPSHTCQIDHQTISDITLDLEQMRTWIHKYDYRKFEYFAEKSLKQPFDTMIRLKCDKMKDYLRTQAICQSTSTGFRCVLIDDRKYHELSREMMQNNVKELNIIWDDEHITLHEPTKYLQLLEHHLSSMILRETN